MNNIGNVTYNMNKVNFSVDGHRVRGFTEDGLTIEPNSDRMTLTMGAMGEYVASISNDRSATITFSLLPGSISLSVLEELANRQEPFSGTLVDMNDDTIKSAEHIWVQSMGNYNRATETEPVEVTLVAGRWE